MALANSARHSTTDPPSVRRRVVNLFIAVVLVLFTLDTLPCTPRVVRSGIEPVLNATGLWQGTWSLFAPTPDRRNHRLQAKIDFADGEHEVWNSPDWRAQTPWRRFVRHREAEFLEKVWQDENTLVWPAFAQSLVRSEMAALGSERRPKQVTLTVYWGDIPPPVSGQWQPASAPVSLDHELDFFRLIYPDRSE